jgi:tight adherence protein B
MSALLAGAAAAAVVLALCGPPPTRPPVPVSGIEGGRAGAPPWVAEASRQLGHTGDPTRMWSLLRAAAAFAAVVGLLAWGVTGALVVLAGSAAAPRLLAPALDRRRLAERDQQLPDAMERVADALRAGARPGPALAEVAQQLPSPLGEELRRAVRGLDHGEALPSVLDRWANRPDASPAVVLAASALELGALAGGGLARAVDGVAATLRERRQLQAEVRALATQARTSAWLLAAAPIAFAVLVAGIEPGVLQVLLATPLGLACLLSGLALDAIGVAWMGRIVRSSS